MKFLDVKDFVKTHEDGHTATLSSPKGHSITVIMKKLSPLQQEQVKRLKLSKGGEIKGVHKPISDAGKSEAGDMARESKMDKRQYKDRHMDNAKHSHKEVLEESKAMPAPKLQGLKDGGEVDVDNKKGTQLTTEQADAIPWTDKGVISGEQLNYDRGGDVQKYDSDGYPVNNAQPLPPPAPANPDKATAFSNTFHAKGGEINRHMYADQEAQVAVDDGAPQTPAASFASAPLDAGTGQLANASVPMNANGTSNMPATSQEVQQGLNEQAAVKSGLGRAGVQEADQHLRAIAAQDQERQKYMNDVSGHVANFADHLKTVDGNSFIRNMDGGDKIAAAFGMLAGGVKQGLIGGDNPAAQWLKERVNADVERQKSANENQKTILGAYQDLYGKGTASLEAARATTALVHATKVKQIADKLATPEAQAAAKLAGAQYSQMAADSIRKGSLDPQLETGYGVQQPEQPPVAPAGAPVGNAPHGGGGATQPQQPPQSGAAHTVPAQGILGRFQQAKEQFHKNDNMEHSSESNPASEDLKPGLGVAPNAPPPHQIMVNDNKMKQSQFYGSIGAPGQLSPGEVAKANDEADQARKINQSTNEVHKQFAEMFKNAENTTGITKYIADQGISHFRMPDVTNVLSDKQKQYYTAVAAVQKILANIIPGGFSEEMNRTIENNLPNQFDTPAAYRQKLDNVDKAIGRIGNFAVTKKYKLVHNTPDEW